MFRLGFASSKATARFARDRLFANAQTARYKWRTIHARRRDRRFVRGVASALARGNSHVP